LDAENLSEGGLFLRSDLLFEVGEALILEIPLPNGTVTETPGRVAWVTRGEGRERTAGMGIEFARLSLEDRRALADRLRDLAKTENKN
jgi:Tfp pilus assembly protein PilZ